jgi:hypothetical protein
MPAFRPRTSRLALLGAAATVAAGATVAQALTPVAPQKITAAGVGDVKLGKRYTTLRADGLVGKLRPGCELAGPQARSATLRLPLKGSVDFTQTVPRRATIITVRGNAQARGVGIGATTAQVKAKFPKAVVDHSTDAMFAITLVKVPKSGGGRIQFAVDTTTKKVTLIGIPRIPFCE